jgi:hypothetical protein
MENSYVFCNYEGAFPQSIRHFQHTFANSEKDTVHRCSKIPCLDFKPHRENFVYIFYHLQNGVHAVLPSQCQRGGSRTVQDLGCEQDGEEEPTPFFVIASRVRKLV